MNTLSTSGILALLNPEQQKELYYALQMVVPPTNTDVKPKLKELEQKYFDLVWFARSRPENKNIPGVKAKLDKVKADYPKEVEGIKGPNGDWQHGFNSGLLACTRLVSAYALPHNYRCTDGNCDSDSDDDESDSVVGKANEIEFANREFPSLDT